MKRERRVLLEAGDSPRSAQRPLITTRSVSCFNGRGCFMALHKVFSKDSKRLHIDGFQTVILHISLFHTHFGNSETLNFTAVTSC